MGWILVWVQNVLAQRQANGVADAGLESIQILRHVDENGRARRSSMPSICQFNVMSGELWSLVCGGCCDFEFQKLQRSRSCEDRTSLPQGSLRPKPGQKSVWGRLGTVDAH